MNRGAFRSAIAVALLGLLAGCGGAPTLEDVPAEWLVGGSMPSGYEAGVLSMSDDGAPVFVLRSVAAAPRGTVAVGREVELEPYRSGRWRFTALITARGAGRAGLYLFADGEVLQGLLFDNMEDRPVEGDGAAWEASIVFEVPPDAVLLAMGLWFEGNGEAQFDHPHVAPAPDVPTTTRSFILSTALDFNDVAGR